MTFLEPPRSAAWQHIDARRGFEVVFFRPEVEGLTTAVEDENAWAVHYAIALRSDWRTITAKVTGHSAAGERRVVLESDGRGQWQVDGRHRPELDGCFDVDLESSAFTNALPVHRLDLDVGEKAEAPAAYVRAADLSVERLEQQYVRLARQRYHYSAPSFDFECELVYDESGLVIDYPGIATRAA